MPLKIIQRYVIGEVVRSFCLALLTLTAIFVLFMIMAEASRFGLTPRDIVTLIPFVIPGTLPYSVPVSLLFAVTVVYGRLASDNEIVAIKSAGLGVGSVLWPSVFLGLGLTLSLLYLSSDTIPRANRRFKTIFFKSAEDAFYKWLKLDRQIDNLGWPFMIKVKDVRERTMLYATFKHRAKPTPDNPTPYDMIVMAEKAVIHFDIEHSVAHVFLEKAQVIQLNGSSREAGAADGPQGKLDPARDKPPIVNPAAPSSQNPKRYQSSEAFFEKLPIDFDLPKNSMLNPYEKTIQEWTNTEMLVQQADLWKKLAEERKKQAIRAGLEFATGRVAQFNGFFGGVDWSAVQQVDTNYDHWIMRWNSFETERQMRLAMSFASLFFVILGAPVGIMFARRDFLSAFITCFVPIITVYYPLMLLGVNLGKEGIVNASLALWFSNFVLFALFWVVFPPVRRH